jgi:hypothetical protein
VGQDADPDNRSGAEEQPYLTLDQAKEHRKRHPDVDGKHRKEDKKKS